MVKRFIIHGILASTLLLGMGQARSATLGDVTLDNQVGVEDAVSLLRFLVGTQAPTPAQQIIGDVYPLRPGSTGREMGSGSLNVQDAVTLLQYSVGLITPVEFGAFDTFLALSPRVVELGPRDQQQFAAVSFNFDGPVEWRLSSSGVSTQLGALSVDGLYIAPDSVPRSFTVNVHAKVGGAEKIAAVFLSNLAPPPPPPPPPPPGG